jgi:hypothetical protein
MSSNSNNCSWSSTKQTASKATEDFKACFKNPSVEQCVVKPARTIGNDACLQAGANKIAEGIGKTVVAIVKPSQ